MLPDTLEGSIHDLTQNILADYTAGRPIDRIEPFNQPDRDVIIALIGKLRRIVFPGYFRDPAYHVYSAAHSLSALIEDTAYLLQKQIAIALRCGSSVTQEAAADIDRQAQEMTIRFLEKIPRRARTAGDRPASLLRRRPGGDKSGRNHYCLSGAARHHGQPLGARAVSAQSAADSAHHDRVRARPHGD